MEMTESELLFRLTVVVVFSCSYFFHNCIYLLSFYPVYIVSNVKYRLYSYIKYKWYPTFGMRIGSNSKALKLIHSKVFLQGTFKYQSSLLMVL